MSLFDQLPYEILEIIGLSLDTDSLTNFIEICQLINTDPFWWKYIKSKTNIKDINFCKYFNYPTRETYYSNIIENISENVSLSFAAASEGISHKFYCFPINFLDNYLFKDTYEKYMNSYVRKSQNYEDTHAYILIDQNIVKICVNMEYYNENNNNHFLWYGPGPSFPRQLSIINEFSIEDEEKFVNEAGCLLYGKNIYKK